MVTSVGENEGKSTVAANLALALAQKERRVILLDCDFRKPSMHKIFEVTVDKEKSLVSYLLADEMSPEEYVIEHKKHGVLVGTSHNCTRNITKMLNNGKLPALLKHLRTQADYIILDTPPMLAIIH